MTLKEIEKISFANDINFEYKEKIYLIEYNRLKFYCSECCIDDPEIECYESIEELGKSWRIEGKLFEEILNEIEII